MYEKDRTLQIATIITVLLFIYFTGLTITLSIVINDLESKHDSNVHIVIVERYIPKVINIPDTPKEESEPKISKHEETKKEVDKQTEETTTKDIKEEPKTEVKKMDDDTYLLAQIISAEAKGEPYKGMIAVGNVVLNRVNDSQFPDTIRGVIFQKGQFSPVSNGSIHNKPSDQAIQAAKEVVDGKQVVDDDAIFFYNPQTSTSDWIFTRKVSTTIGNHAFAF